MCGGEKRKNTEVSAKSVGLPVVPFQYGLSLFVCLSKWFTFLVRPSVTVRLHGRLLRLLLTFGGLAPAAFRKLLLLTKRKSTVKIKILKQTRHKVPSAERAIRKTAFAYAGFCPAGARPLLGTGFISV